MSIVDAIKCTYVWFKILGFVDRTDRHSVALTCRFLSRLAIWVDPIASLHDHVMRVENVTLANSIIDYHDLLTADGRERLDQTSLVNLLCSVCSSRKFDSLYQSLLAHSRFDLYMLSLFGEAARECFIIARRLLSDREALFRLLHAWSNMDQTMVHKTRPALENMCKIAGQYRCKGAVGYILSLGYDIGKTQSPEEPCHSHSFQTMCSWFLIGAARQRKVEWFEKVANLPFNGLRESVVLACFDNALSFRSWNVLERMLLVQQPVHRQFIFNRLLAAFSSEMTDMWVPFASVFIRVDQNGDTLTDNLCYNFVRVAFVECINQADQHADTFDDCCGRVLDAIVALLRHRASVANDTRQVAYQTLRLVCIFSVYDDYPDLIDFVHNLFHELQPFLLLERSDWIDFVGDIDNLVNSKSCASACIVEWVRKRQEADVAEASHRMKRQRI